MNTAMSAFEIVYWTSVIIALAAFVIC
jgi:drug/metabolite transporter (DMT)-like permease